MVVSPAQAADACGCDGETQGQRQARVGMAMRRFSRRSYHTYTRAYLAHTYHSSYSEESGIVISIVKSVMCTTTVIQSQETVFVWKIKRQQSTASGWEDKHWDSKTNFAWGYEI